MKAGKGRVAKGAEPSGRDRRPVSLKDVKWKGIDIPAMALAPSSSRPKDLKGKGKAKGKKKQEADSGDESVEDDDGGDGAWDPFADLDEGADDFMGLQEVSGVGVQFEGDEKTGRRVGFYRTDGDRSGGDDKQNEAEGSRSAQKKAKKVRGEVEDVEGAAPAQQDAVSKKATQKEKNAKGKAGKGSEGKKQQSRQADEVAVDKEAATESLADRNQSDESREQNGEDADGIPEGLFSAFATNQDEQSEGLDLKAASFDDKNLKQWPKAALDQLHPILKRALHNLSFTEPTPVQKKTLPLALPSQSSTTSARDVVALAQTGSGKTLAYALPILQGILQAKMSAEERDTETPPLQALIVLPTRELALQVYEVFQKVVAASVQSAIDSGDEDGESANHKRWARIAPVVGGMSEERQWRLLQGRKGSKGHDAQIIVATVGRLWELCKSEDYLPRRLDTAKTLVLDEADRLMETGKFQELSSVLELLHNKERQTMLFSATLDPALQVNLTKSRAKISKMLKQSRGGTDTAMANLIDRVGFRDPLGPCMVDLTQDARLSENLKEGKIECVETEKDLYLYYLVLRYPASFLVFLNSIDSVRRLQPLLANLGVQSFPLHGDMDQRSRLRSLDGFKRSLSGKNKVAASQSTVLLATDVAARGLDIPLVPYVVHFHLPRAADTYIHRSGRTARAGQSGLSLILLSPGEKSRWNSLRRGLGRTDDGDLKDLPIMMGVMGRLKTRLRLAKELDEARHRQSKSKADDDWMRKMADEAEIALDDDDGVDADADYSAPSKGGKGGKANDSSALRGLEKQLAHELSQDLIVRGVKRKFLTQGAGSSETADLLKELVSGTGHESFVGLSKTTAEGDLGGKMDGSGAVAGKKSKKIKRD